MEREEVVKCRGDMEGEKSVESVVGGVVDMDVGVATAEMHRNSRPPANKCLQVYSVASY